MSIAMFLLGGRAGPGGAIRTTRTALRRRGWVWLGLAALPLDLAIGTVGDTAGMVFARYTTAPVVALGLLGATACLMERRRGPGAAQRRLADVGRAALSCYVLQNLICCALCYGWGLGLASRMGDARTWWTLALYLTVCTLVIAFAQAWLRRFTQGPLETLWAWAYQLPQRR